MKKAIFTLLACLCAQLIGFAQYAPKGAKWYFTGYDGVGSGSKIYHTFEITKDTLINGDVYSIIQYKDAKGLGREFYNQYYLSQQKGVLYYYFEGSRKVLFDLNAQVGDTIYIDAYESYKTVKTIKVRITDKEWIKINSLQNDSLRQYTFRDVSNQSQGFFVEKIIKYKPTMSDNLLNIVLWFYAPEGANIIRCYNDSNYSFKFKDFKEDCNYSNVSIKPLKEQNDFKILNIYPNPSKGIFTLQTTLKGHCTISNELGQTIQQFDLLANTTHLIDLSAVSNGMYFIQFVSNNKQYSHKLVKQ